MMCSLPRTLGTFNPISHGVAADGAITSVLIQVGEQLRRYDPTLSSSTLLIDGIVGQARLVGHTADADYFSYKDSAGTARIYPFGRDGKLRSPVYSAANSELLRGYDDGNTTYVVQRPSSGPDALVRVPYAADGTPRILYTADRNGGILATLGATSRTVVIAVGVAEGQKLIAIEKTTGATTVDIVSASHDLSGFLDGDRIVWTQRDGHDANGSATTSGAGISDDQGMVLAQYDRSEWIEPIAVETVLTRHPQISPIGGLLLRGYTGSYDSDGHRGGTLSYQDFASGSGIDLGPVAESAFIRRGRYSGPVGLAFQRATSPGGTADVVAYDLENGRFTLVTHTPDISELIP